MTRILVIEDEQTILENILETLELEGFEVGGAPNGVEGVRIARTYLPDIIVCDIMMPELDGYGVLFELRSEPSTATIPFIFLTARADRAAMRRGMELGADDYLTKPFTPAELLAAVNARLEKHALLAKEYEQKLTTLRENIVYALPHELRTPLSGILSCADFLVMDYASLESERVLSLLQIINRSAVRLQKLIENYLSYAQIEILATDEKRVRALRACQTDDAGTVIGDTASRKAAQYQREADLALEIPNAALPILEDNLRKIVEELVDNAFKFSESGSPVQVRAGVSGRVYQLCVSNQGRGMTPQQIKDIGAYIQFGRAVYEQQGLGLGLIIAKRLTELHGGQMDIDSVPGEWTAVCVSLPLSA